MPKRRRNPLIEPGGSCRHMSLACTALYPYPTEAEIAEAQEYYDDEYKREEAKDFAEQARMG